jgi:hypothetical protein
VQVRLQVRTAITDTPTTRPSERLVRAAEMTEGMAGPGRTAPAAAIFRMECPAEAEFDTSVLQMWRRLFYPRGDESIRLSASRLTDVWSMMEREPLKPSL